MSGKLFDFLSSFGLMIAGVGLTFCFTLSFPALQRTPVFVFPESGPSQMVVNSGPKELPKSQPVFPVAKNTEPYTATLTAYAAVVLDERTGRTLYEKNALEQRPLASMTKLMSALVLLDLSPSWTATATVTEADNDTSSHIVNVGETYHLSDLWLAALVGSSNSAVRTLIRSLGVSQEEFVARMNDKARRLGLSSLLFVDPTGLNSGNIGGAMDAARLLSVAIKKEKIADALRRPEITLRPLNKKDTHRIWSTNWLLTNWIPNDFDKTKMAGKTGFINDARYNVVVRLVGGSGRPIIAAVLGSETNESRFEEARDLAKWVFRHYLWPGDEGYPAGE